MLTEEMQNGKRWKSVEVKRNNTPQDDDGDIGKYLGKQAGR